MIPAIRCAEPIADGLCPHLLGACPNHPVCGAVEPLTLSAWCRRKDCDGTHAGDGHDAWTTEALTDSELPEENRDAR